MRVILMTLPSTNLASSRNYSINNGVADEIHEMNEKICCTHIPYDVDLSLKRTNRLPPYRWLHRYPLS